MSNRDEIEKALSYIEPHDRDVWVNTAYSLKHELGEEAFDMWDRWSQQSDSYRSRDARSVWKSIKNPTRTIASLFYDARANGYRPDTPYTPPSAEEQARRQAEAAAAREAAQRQQQENHLRVSKTAQRIWRNAAPASLAHPYLAAKGITDPAVLGGIRQSEYQGVLNLQIPIYRDGTLYNLQSISPDGGKHFLKDGLKSGGYTVVGDAADTARGIVVAEGFATAASIHQATGKPVVVAFDAGNMVTVSETLAKNLPQDIPVTIAVQRRIRHRLGQSAAGGRPVRRPGKSRAARIYHDADSAVPARKRPRRQRPPEAAQRLQRPAQARRCRSGQTGVGRRSQPCAAGRRLRAGRRRPNGRMAGQNADARTAEKAV